ncbi:MAG: sel1 repeat family protein [Lachnospiraceae bacterium]|nr:sel1 repeat family protein [Lachnospiraceae bacterium]
MRYACKFCDMPAYRDGACYCRKCIHEYRNNPSSIRSEYKLDHWDDSYYVSVKAKQKSKEVYYYLAGVYRELGDYFNAFDCYLETIRFNSKNNFDKKKEAEIYFYLGLYSAYGMDTEQNFINAAIYYEKSAEFGSVGALNNLGTLYKDGTGVKRDIQKAKELYERAVNMGHPNAMTNLADLYKTGNGVPKDIYKAVELYERAVSLDNANAMQSLGKIYRNGNIGLPNLTKAKELFERAVRLGNENAKKDLEEVEERISLLNRGPRWS